MYLTLTAHRRGPILTERKMNANEFSREATRATRRRESLVIQQETR